MSKVMENSSSLSSLLPLVIISASAFIEQWNPALLFLSKSTWKEFLTLSKNDFSIIVHISPGGRVVLILSDRCYFVLTQEFCACIYMLQFLSFLFCALFTIILLLFLFTPHTTRLSAAVILVWWTRKLRYREAKKPPSITQSPELGIEHKQPSSYVHVLLLFSTDKF